MTPRKTNIKCGRTQPYICNYKWFTKSKAYRVSCPSCGYSTINPNYVEAT